MSPDECGEVLDRFWCWLNIFALIWALKWILYCIIFKIWSEIEMLLSKLTSYSYYNYRSFQQKLNLLWIMKIHFFCLQTAQAVRLSSQGNDLYLDEVASGGYYPEDDDDFNSGSGSGKHTCKKHTTSFTACCWRKRWSIKKEIFINSSFVAVKCWI